MSKVMPIRIQRSRKHKQVSPNGLPIVYVGRPSKWGNPWRLGDEIIYTFYNRKTIKTMDELMDMYYIYARVKIANVPGWLDELSGKNLSCWCPLSEKCHAGILIKLANE